MGVHMYGHKHCQRMHCVAVAWPHREKVYGAGTGPGCLWALVKWGPHSVGAQPAAKLLGSCQYVCSGRGSSCIAKDHATALVRHAEPRLKGQGQPKYSLQASLHFLQLRIVNLRWWPSFRLYKHRLPSLPSTHPLTHSPEVDWLQHLRRSPLFSLCLMLHACWIQAPSMVTG